MVRIIFILHSLILLGLSSCVPQEDPAKSNEVASSEISTGQSQMENSLNRASTNTAIGSVSLPNGPIVVMQAVHATMSNRNLVTTKALSDSVEFQYAVAKGNSTIKNRIVDARKHQSGRSTTFISGAFLDTSSYIGAYIPVGYRTYYQYKHINKISNSRCYQDLREPFSKPVLYKSATSIGSHNDSPLRLGRDFKLQNNKCLVIRWLLEKIHDTNYSRYYGNKTGIYEKPIVVKNGHNQFPITKQLLVQSQGGIGIDLGVSESFGGIAKHLKIKGRGNSWIDILNNGAPTDDGLVWGVRVQDAKGLYNNKNLNIKRSGSSQFAGHTAINSLFGNSMWGLRVPMTKSVNARFYKELTPNKSICGTECLTPMFSDYTVLPYGKSSKTFETSPFFRPYSIHTWDGRVDKIALATLRDKNNRLTEVNRLVYQFSHRAHRSFSTSKEYAAGLWFNQKLQNRPTIHIVYSDNQVRSINGNLLMNPTQNVTYSKNRFSLFSNTDISAANSLWKDLCRGAPRTTYKYCQRNPNHNNDTSCSCTGESKVKRIVYEFPNKGVALSLKGDGALIKSFTLGMVYRSIPFTPNIVTNISSKFAEKNKLRIHQNRVLNTERYYFHVGTMEELNRAGYGTR